MSVRSPCHFSPPSGWNVGVMVSAPAAILDPEVRWSHMLSLATLPALNYLPLDITIREDLNSLLSKLVC